MRLLDVLTSPWAIEPAKMSEIRNIYLAHLHGPKIDWEGLQSRVLTMLPDNKDEKPYKMIGDVAVIDIQGILTKGFSGFFSFLFGGTSMSEIADAINEAINDPMVSSLILNIDSPGGTVDGTQELSNMIYSLRGKKNIIAYTDGVVASAAYWIGSAANKIYISGDTNQIGSIGVVAIHTDLSKQDEMMGEKITEITSGKYKRIASEHSPLTAEGKDYLQAEADYLLSAFVNDALIQNRGMSQDAAAVLSDGKVYIGKQAISAGLVDGVSTMNGLIARYSRNPAPKYIRAMIDERINEATINVKLKERST
jgi:capsid assembly protease